MSKTVLFIIDDGNVDKKISMLQAQGLPENVTANVAIVPDGANRGECKIVCVKSNCADLFYAPYWGKQLKGWISNGKT